MPSYTISDDGKAITCGACGVTSHNPHDVAERYCGHCHVFHDDAVRTATWAKVRARGTVKQKGQINGFVSTVIPIDSQATGPWQLQPSTAIEFDCRECGRHIISIGNQSLAVTHPDTCAACFSIPRWYLDPELAQAIDPHGLRNPPAGRLH